MKHKFLLDENILYCAIKGVDERDNKDLTAVNLVRFIAENCHSIVFDEELRLRYYRHIQGLINERSPITQPVFFIIQFIKNLQKVDIIYEPAPYLAEENNYPREDIHIVRVAHYFQALTSLMIENFEML